MSERQYDEAFRANKKKTLIKQYKILLKQTRDNLKYLKRYADQEDMWNTYLIETKHFNSQIQEMLQQLGQLSVNK